MTEKTYLGDGVYADYDGYHIILTVGTGITETQRVCLEPNTLKNLGIYATKLGDMVGQFINKVKDKDEPSSNPGGPA